MSKGSHRRPEDRKAVERNWPFSPRDPIPGPGGVIGEGRRRGVRLTAAHRKPPERRRFAR